MNTTALAFPAFNTITEDLDAIAAKNEALAFDYRSKKGEKDARSQIYTLRKLNGAIDARHKELKADILEQGRAIDGARRDLKGRVAEMIEVHEAPLKQIEAEAAEAAAKIEAVFTALRDTAIIDPDAIADAVANTIGEVEAIDVSADTCKERLPEAQALRAQLVGDAGLGGMLRRATEREERDAENARLTALAEKLERENNEARIAKEATEAAERKAAQDAADEKKRVDEAAAEKDRQIAADKEAADKRIRDAEAAAEKQIEDAAAAVEADRLKAEREEEAERVAAEKRAANKKNRERVLAGIAADLAEHAGLSKDDAVMVAARLGSGNCPAVTVTF